MRDEHLQYLPPTGGYPEPPQEVEEPEEAAVVIRESKPGWKTTEFWVAVVTLVAVNLNGVVLTLPDKYQAIATAVVAGLYALARGLAKQGIPDVEPTVPEA